MNRAALRWMQPGARVVGRQTVARRPLASRINAVPLLAPEQQQVAQVQGQVGKRWLSGKGGSGETEDSHPDFAAKSKVDTTDDVQQFLDENIKKHDVLLFMKGSAEAPRCGFSARVVQILQQQGIDFSSADVLASAEIREGIKQYSEWPTIPQLFINGEFVGGCDIVVDMDSSGELEEMLAPIKEKQRAAEN